MTEYTKGDRVSYTVMYGVGPARSYNRTEYGKVTRVMPGGARGEPQATIAVENPVPGAARYVKRYVTDIAPAGRSAAGSFEDKAARYPGSITFTDRNGPRCEAWTGCRMDPGHDGPHYPQTGWHEHAIPAYVADAPAHVHCGVAGHTDPGEEETHTCYTREQIVAAINAAADLTGELLNPSGYESSESIRTDDAMNMVTNVAGYLLDHPDGTVDDVILENWSSEEEDFENAGVEAEPTDEAGKPRDHTEAEQQAVDEAQIERIRGWFE